MVSNNRKQMKKTIILPKRIIAIFVALILTVIGTRYDDLYGGFFLKIDKLSQVQGKVTRISIVKSSSRKGFYSHLVTLEYEFYVGNKIYFGNKIDFGVNSFSRFKDAQRFSEQYSKDKPVTVFYKSEKPEFSVLNPNRNSNYDFVSVFVSIVALYLLVVWVFNRSIEKNRLKTMQKRVKNKRRKRTKRSR